MNSRMLYLPVISTFTSVLVKGWICGNMLFIYLSVTASVFMYLLHNNLYF